MQEFEMAPIFSPSMEEFRDFKSYVESIQPLCKNGICKIIPPKEWNSGFNYERLDDPEVQSELFIPHPIKQIVTGNKGVYQLVLMEEKRQSLLKFKMNAEKEKMPKNSKYQEGDSVDRVFWKTVKFNAPTYGADMSGSLFKDFIDEQPTCWNPNSLPSILNVVGASQNLPGITTPYLYFGMWKAMFAWHVEDMNLFSINYLHFGEPKSWYAVSPENGPKLESVARALFPELDNVCHEFLRHKTTLISPNVLADHSIPVTKVVQEKGQIVITFPYSYHCGYNNGFNCAESVNFALESWIEWGRKAKACTCQADAATINMDLFMEIYEEWKKNPVDLSLHQVTEPPPSISPKRKMKGSPTKQTPKKQKETNETPTATATTPTGDTESPTKKYTKISKEGKAFLMKIFHEEGAIPSLERRYTIAEQVGWTPQGVYHFFRRKVAKLPPKEEEKEKRTLDEENVTIEHNVRDDHSSGESSPEMKPLKPKPIKQRVIKVKPPLPPKPQNERTSSLRSAAVASN